MHVGNYKLFIKKIYKIRGVVLYFKKKEIMALRKGGIILPEGTLPTYVNSIGYSYVSINDLEKFLDIEPDVLVEILTSNKIYLKDDTTIKKLIKEIFEGEVRRVIDIKQTFEVIRVVHEYKLWPHDQVKYANSMFVFIGKKVSEYGLPPVDIRIEIFVLPKGHPAYKEGQRSFGVRVKEDIILKKGETIVLGYYAGDYVPVNLCGSSRYIMESTDKKGCMQIDAEKRGNELRFINDIKDTGKEVNCKIGDPRPLNDLADMRPIILTRSVKKGEELLMEYGDKYWNNLVDEKKPEAQEEKENVEKNLKRGDIIEIDTDLTPEDLDMGPGSKGCYDRELAETAYVRAIVVDPTELMVKLLFNGKIIKIKKEYIHNPIMERKIAFKMGDSIDIHLFRYGGHWFKGRFLKYECTNCGENDIHDLTCTAQVEYFGNYSRGKKGLVALKNIRPAQKEYEFEEEPNLEVEKKEKRKRPRENGEEEEKKKKKVVKKRKTRTRIPNGPVSARQCYKDVMDFMGPTLRWTSKQIYDSVKFLHPKNGKSSFPDMFSYNIWFVPKSPLHIQASLLHWIKEDPTCDVHYDKSTKEFFVDFLEN